MRIQIMDKRWNLRFASNLSNHGECQAPTVRDKQMRILSSLRGKRRLTVLIHEMLHAANWHLDEQFVAQASEDIANVLWRLGYRQCGHKADKEPASDKPVV
jgi:hypothetical protein